MNERKLTLSAGPYETKVELDGQDISRALRGITIRCEAAHRPSVDLDLKLDAIEVARLAVRDPDFIVSMSDDVRDALIALGWTPPGVVNKIRDLRAAQGTNGTWNASGYMRGLHNGLELALSILEGERDPQFKEAPADGNYLCDRPTPDMSGPEFEPVSGDAAGTPPAGDR